MKTLPELLRDADPLATEPVRSVQERHAVRQTVRARSAKASRLRSLRELRRGRLRSPAQRPDERIALPPRRTVLAGIAAIILAGGAAALLDWTRTSVDLVAAVRFEARLAEEQPGTGLREAVISLAGRKIYLHPEAILTNGDIAGAQVVPGSTASTFGVAISLTRDGASKIFGATQGHVGKPIAILIDGQVVTAPTLRSPISTAGVISGDFTKAEAERIASGILGR